MVSEDNVRALKRVFALLRAREVAVENAAAAYAAALRRPGWLSGMAELRELRQAKGVLDIHHSVTLRGMHNTMAKVVEAIEVGMDWQPITTAPKDEDQLALIYDPHSYPEICVASFSAHHESVGRDAWWPAPAGEGMCHVYPTHWMPLPAPPKEAEKQEP